MDHWPSKPNSLPAAASLSMRSRRSPRRRRSERDAAFGKEIQKSSLKRKGVRSLLEVCSQFPPREYPSQSPCRLSRTKLYRDRPRCFHESALLSLSAVSTDL